MSIVVRPIRPDEWRELRAIRLASLLDAPSAFARTHDEELAYPDQYWIDAARDRSNGDLSGTFVGVQASGEFVGMVGGYRPEPDAEPRWAELVSMWVAPAGRRQGLAQQLVTSVETWARERDCLRVELWVTRGNDPAITMYHRAGFIETGDVAPLPSDPCKDELRMHKMLMT